MQWEVFSTIPATWPNSFPLYAINKKETIDIIIITNLGQISAFEDGGRGREKFGTALLESELEFVQIAEKKRMKMKRDERR